MKRFLTDRVEAFGALGQAAVDLARAEGTALGNELKGSGRRLLGALLLLVLALFVAFWALGALVYVAIALAGLWLAPWAAAASVLAALALLGVVLGLIGWRRLKRVDSPAATIQRRAGDYRDWWEGRVAPSSRGQAGGDGRAGSERAGPRGAGRG